MYSPAAALPLRETTSILRCPGVSRSRQRPTSAGISRGSSPPGSVWLIRRPTSTDLSSWTLRSTVAMLAEARGSMVSAEQVSWSCRPKIPARSGMKGRMRWA